MKKDYKAVIFDVDGTLLDTTEGVIAAVQYTIEQCQLPQLAQAELLEFIGPPIQDSFRLHYEIDNKNQLQEIATIFRNRYKDYELLKASPYLGIYEVCDQLMQEGKKIAVATYKRQDYATEILEHFGFNRYSDFIYGADHENKMKKVDIICKCIDDMGLSNKQDVVMVGDSVHDATGALQIGIDFIGVTYGFDFRSKEDVMKYKNAVGSADCPHDILKFFLETGLK